MRAAGPAVVTNIYLNPSDKVRCVRLTHNDDSTLFVYCNLDEIHVELSDQIKPGQIVASSGDNPPVLHYEIWINENQSFESIDPLGNLVPEHLFQCTPEHRRKTAVNLQPY